MFHGRKIDDCSMVKIDSTTTDNHESTFSAGTYDFENDTGTHKTFTLAKYRKLLNCLAIPLILLSLLPASVVLIVTTNPMLRMNYFLIMTLKRVVMMKPIVIVTLV